MADNSTENTQTAQPDAQPADSDGLPQVEPDYNSIKANSGMTLPMLKVDSPADIKYIEYAHQDSGAALSNPDGSIGTYLYPGETYQVGDEAGQINRDLAVRLIEDRVCRVVDAADVEGDDAESNFGGQNAGLPQAESATVTAAAEAAGKPVQSVAPKLPNVSVQNAVDTKGATVPTITNSADKQLQDQAIVPPGSPSTVPTAA